LVAALPRCALGVCVLDYKDEDDDEEDGLQLDYWPKNLWISRMTSVNRSTSSFVL
jgi:hypothetical protein